MGKTNDIVDVLVIGAGPSGAAFTWRLSEAGIDFRLELPHIGFRRNVGTFRDHHVSPGGRLLDDAEWGAGVDDWLPSEADRAHVQSVMDGVTEPGKMAGWVAPPARGIHQRPIDYQYVQV